MRLPLKRCGGGVESAYYLEHLEPSEHDAHRRGWLLLRQPPMKKAFALLVKVMMTLYCCDATSCMVLRTVSSKGVNLSVGKLKWKKKKG